MYDGHMDFGRINYAHIALASKFDGAVKVQHFRPISLINCSFKIIMKVLTNRLRNVIGLLVDKVQSGFIKYRFILENVAIAQQVISSVDSNKEQGVLLKVDFGKAYDKVGILFLTC